MRILPFVSGDYYHIYNRGVDKRIIFSRFGHYRRFLTTIHSILETGSATQRPTNNQSLALKLKVEIVAYCLMPNHFHFLLHQTIDGGITELMHKLDTSYTKYFNLNAHRSGRLFEYTFKAKRIESDELLLHVARYIHLNPVIAHLVPSLDLWPWSSFHETIGKREPTFCISSHIINFFGNENAKQNYEHFVTDQIAYAQLLHDASTQDEDSLYL